MDNCRSPYTLILNGAQHPCAMLSPEGDGPVVGHFGGPLVLPPDVPDPRSPIIASIDCAALPGDATDLPLPAGGRLLVLAIASGYWEDGGGQVIYVPPGAGVEERTETHDFLSFEDPQAAEILEQYPRGPIHLTAKCLPAYLRLGGSRRLFLRNAGP